MDSRIKEKIDIIKDVLTGNLNYISALELNDADLSEKTLNDFIDGISEAFDELQRNVVNDICAATDKKQLTEQEEICKFVSLF